MFSLENELLVMISQIDISDNEVDKIDILCSKELNWQYIVAQAARNKVVCLLYFHLYQNRKIFKIDDWIYKIIEKYYMATRDVLRIFNKEMIDICSTLNERNILYAILKGVNLQERLYAQKPRCIREFEDIDILVKKQDIKNIQSILRNKGYAQGKFDFMNERIESISRQEELYWRLHTNQIGKFIKIIQNGKVTQGDICTVDVNFTIFEGGKKNDKIKTEQLLNNVTSTGAKKYNVLNTEYDFLQVCYHFYKDIFYENKIDSRNDYILAKFCDVKEYVSQYRTIIDWKHLTDMIKEYDLNEAIYSTLFLVSKLYTNLNIDEILQNIKVDNVHEINTLVNMDEYIRGMIFRL